MSLNPIIVTKKKDKGALSKKCKVCNEVKSKDKYIMKESYYFPDGHIDICNDCIKKMLIKEEWHWNSVDRLCRYIDIPFIPKEFERLKDINEDNVFPIYAKVFQDSKFDGLNWSDYFEYFKELQLAKIIENELPEIHEDKINKLKVEWGANYDEEELYYLENLYNGMLSTQNVNGALQIDQAKKLCKMSLSIDECIRAGENFDKIMASYDKMVKSAEFTPKNAKNENDLDSVGELFAWLERRGWLNQYFDGVSRDVVDEVLQNLQSFNRKLYIGESGIGEDITSRVEALKIADKMKEVGSDQLYDLGDDYDLEQYDQSGYDNLIKEEFIVDEDDDADIEMKGV